MLAIVVGHTIDAPGVKGARPINKHEYQWNFDFSALVYMEARHLGMDCRVYIRKEGESRRKLAQRVSEAADCAIELHFNGFNKEVSGTETLYDEDPIESKELAQIVHDKMVKVFGRTGKRDRGLKLIDDEQDRGWSNLNGLTIPACLVEPVFGDNIQEAELLESKKMEYAKALAEAAFEFLYKEGY